MSFVIECDSLYEYIYFFVVVVFVIVLYSTQLYPLCLRRRSLDIGFIYFKRVFVFLVLYRTVLDLK